MRQKKNERIKLVLPLLCVMLTFNLIAVRAEKEYILIVSLQAPEPTSSGGFGIETRLFEGGLICGSDEMHESAYIFDSNWDILTTIPTPTPQVSATFGLQVDAYGDMIAVGNERATINDLKNSGSVYLFDDEGSLIHELQPPVQGKFQLFGAEVALGNGIVLVAEPGGPVEGVYHAGLVRVFDYEGGYIRNLTSPSMRIEGTFGWSLDANDEYVLVGEPGYIPMRVVPDICSVYVYDYDWNHLATLKAPDGMKRTSFGISTSISGDYVVVGEPWATVNGLEKAGRAHIFDTGWNHVATLQSPTPEAMAEFGGDVATGGDIVVVGECKGDVDSMNEGKVHVFDLEGDLIATLVSPEPAVSAFFGYSVETDGEIIVVGETAAEVDGEPKAGRVHIFGLGEAAVEQPTHEEETESESDSESESKNTSGVPGFPLESVIISIVLAVLVLVQIQKQRVRNIG